MAGMSLAQGDAVAAIAADLQDPPDLLHEMIALWRSDHKVVIAARRQRERPLPRPGYSRIFFTEYSGASPSKPCRAAVLIFSSSTGKSARS